MHTQVSSKKPESFLGLVVLFVLATGCAIASGLTLATEPFCKEFGVLCEAGIFKLMLIGLGISTAFTVLAGVLICIAALSWSRQGKETVGAPIDNASLLDLEWDFPEVGSTTIRGYLCALLSRVWIEKDGFTFKRAFGFSNWERDLLQPLIAAGAIEAVADDLDDGRAEALLEQRAKFDALIVSLIALMAAPATPAN